MKQNYFIFFLLWFIFGFLPTSVLASVPETNRMRLGNISSLIPGQEMRDYYAKMEPIMFQYFGPPFSSFNLDVDVSLDSNHDFGIFLEKPNAIMVSQAILYNDPYGDRVNAINNINGFMKHEFSHAMYILGKNETATVGVKWFGEGWVNVMVEIMNNKIDNESDSFKDSYEYYIDKNVASGTSGSERKQTQTHALQYSLATTTHLLLLSAASSSNENLDFYKKLNGIIYDSLKNNGNKLISFDEYKSMIKPLLNGIKIDGEDAYQWYVTSPTFFVDGTLGPHIGAYLENQRDNLEPIKITAFSFSRIQESNRINEYGLANVTIHLIMKDNSEKVILDKNVVTDSEGTAYLELRDKPEILSQLKAGAYFITAEAVINSKTINSKIFALIPPKMNVQKEYLYGVLLDENDNLIDGKYVSLLSSDSNFIYKKNGIFIINVPESQRVLNLNFLGLKQEITKGPFARVYAFRIPQFYVEQAKLKSFDELNKGMIDNTENLIIQNNKNKKFVGCGDGICDADEKSGKNPCEQDCSKDIYQGREPVDNSKIGFWEKIGDWFRNLFRKN